MIYKNKQGLLFSLFTVIIISFQFIYALINSLVNNSMDFLGWVFYLASCISHATMFAIIPYLIFYLPLIHFKKFKTAAFLLILSTVLLCSVNHIDIMVYSLYRFHINGFILNMIFSSSASEIFTIDTMLYIREISLFILLIVLCIFLFKISGRIINKYSAYIKVWPFLTCFIACTVFAHVDNIYSSFYQKPSVMKSARILPYYFPTTANRLMMKMGFNSSVNNAITISDNNGDINYPINPLQVEKPDSLPNIVFILIDSWNKRTFTKDCMPNLYSYSKNNQFFDNHFSSSNGTRSSVFGIFFGITCYYWEDFDANGIRPLFIDRLLKLGYSINTYASATLKDPPFDRVIFGKVPNLRVNTPGETPYMRDQCITKEFITELPKLKSKGKPFFSFVFYDLPHAIALPKEKNNHFKPCWEYADYTKLNNDIDPTGFFNLYRNCCYETDKMVAQVLNSLKQNGLDDNTIVVITGDHSQEFNENKKNYWGHNGNFSKYQVSVPLIVHKPNHQSGNYEYRTTHYDIVPTIMKEYLGVKNSLNDYSMGKLLSDPSPRKWEIVGSNLNYAFIIDKDSILEKTADGNLEVTDSHLNSVVNYKLNAKQFNNAVKKLKRFYKN